MTGSTMAQKVLARASGQKAVEPGGEVDAKIDLLYMHEMLAVALEPFEAMGIERVWNPDKIVVTLDHWVPPPTEEIAKMHQAIRVFCRAQGIARFHDIGDHGIVHQLVAERGYAQPGDLVIGTDSHTNTVGAVGAFAAGIGATDAAAIMGTGRIRLPVPATIRVDIEGTLSRRTWAKDVILKVVGMTGDEGAREEAVEFTGPTVEGFPMNERLTLSNMTTEMGATAGMIAADEVTREYLAHTGRPFQPLAGDEDAVYEETYDVDVDGMGPQVAVPEKPSNVKPVEAVAGTKVEVSFLGSCTSARIEDLRAAAEIMRGEHLAPGMRMIVSPASQRIYRQSVEEGLTQVFTEAGATFANSTCGPCFGGHLGVLAPNEVCISSSNRNYAGRMGSRKARVYLASAMTVAASTIYGEITDPREV
ncbi:MAG: aconitase/3-isopropylmalate dehydratase large subunit family protein [Thermoplasmata archaeon]